MIKIYDIDDNVLIQAELTSAAVREEELSKSDYIQLSFSTAEKLILPVGAYIEHTYKIDKVREVTQKFLLLEAYEPTQTSESSWKYTPKFQHPKMILSKTPFYILTRNSKNEQIKQSVWAFVGVTSSLCEKIADFLNKDIKFGKCGWVCNMLNVTANTVNVSFSDNDFISALTAICNAIGDNCEWHIDYDNEQIYIGKVVIGDEHVLLEVGKNIGSPSINSSKEGYYNSFSVFGGSRNITQTNEKGENIFSGDIRLQLSAGSGSILIDGKQQAFTIDEFSTIDLRKDKKKEPLFTKILDFSDIFPSLNTYAYNVRGRVKYVLDENNKKIPLIYNSDGSVKEYKTFTVWYMRLAYPTTEKVSGKTLINTTIDDGVTHYWYDFEITDDLLINGKNIGCSFEANFSEGALSTPLAGRGTNGDYVGFELTYHDKDELSKTSDDVSDDGFKIKNGDYEIIYQEDNDVIIPSNADSMLIPRGEDKPSLKCNITILYNIAMKESVYEDDAKSRLLEAAKKEIIRLLSDLNNYSFKSYPQIFATDNPCLQIGQNIIYNDGNGYTLESRVLKLTTNIDYDFMQEITIGNQAIKGRTTQLREDVQKIISGGGNNGGTAYTAAQLENIVSKYGINYFLSKKFDDIAKGVITFEKMQKFLSGFVSAGRAILQKGFAIDENGYGFDENGNIIANSLKSLGFDKALNEGFGMEMESAGTSHLYLSNLTIWGKMIVNILEIMKTKYAGGNIYMSAAGGTIVKVVPVGMWDDDDSEWVENPIEEAIQGWKCYILADDGDNAVGNPWQEGDQVRCQSMGNLLGTRYAKATNKSYWRTIPEHGVSSFNEYIYNDYGTPAYNGKMFYWIVLGKHSKDFDGYTEENAPVGTTDIPEAGDSIVLDGSRKDTSRQGVLQLSSYGSGAPSIVGLRGVSNYTHEKCAIFELSYDYVRIFAERFKLIAKNNKVVEITNFRGEWDPTEKYYKNDQVSHNNAIWTCLNDEVWQSEPADDNTAWRKEVYGQKGEDGSSFKVLGTAKRHFVNADDISGELLTDEKYLFDDTSGLPDGMASPCIATYLKVGAGHMWIICKSNDGDSYMIGDDLWTNSGTAWLNIGNVKGVSISSTSVTYGVSVSGTQQPSSWSSVIPPTTDEYPYLWTRTVVNYSDGKSTTSYSVSHNGKDGEKGETGDKGADAITIQLVGAPLIFDAGSDGIVPKGVTNYARLYVTVGEKDVSEYVGQPYSVSSEGMNVSPEDGYVIKRREYNEKMAWYLGIKSDAISKVYLSDNKTEVSATSGYITFVFAYGANQYVGQLPFQVNVARYTGELTLTNKQFKISMDGLTTRMETAEGGITDVNTKLTNEVASLHSEITTTATNVKAEVTEQINGNLKKAGLEVKADGVTLYGDKITITNDDGKTTTALFANGKINASLIDADKIEVKHLWAKSNDGASKVGYFGNTEEEACKIDDTYAPLFVGADTAKNSPFYVTNKGHMVSKSATLGSFSLNESSLRYLTGYDDEEPGFALYNEYMVFRGYSRTFSPQTKKWTSERNRLIWVGRNDWVYSVPSLMSNILVQDSFPMTTGDTAKIGLRISVTGCDDKYQYEDVNYNGAMGSNVYGNFAIYAENGMYAGFRPMTRMANHSMKLTELDCVIYVSVTGITLTLPDNPQRGQCYKFIQGAGSFHIKSSSKNIYSMHVGQTDNFTSDSYNQITEIIWIGDHWRINWFRESVGK
nr:MAG TPA: tail protein [Caudoviricetes sp.]